MGSRLSIWAPHARTVDVVIGELRIAAEPDGHGAWIGPVLRDGARYSISLDRKPPLPDPRSRSQPDGVNAPSAWLDVRSANSTFRPASLTDAVIYELHVGTFSSAGTFEGAVPHLDALSALGVTHIELMPIAQFSGVHGWGYDGVDLFAPHAPYGGPAALRTFIEQCHARGLAVLVDVVHNHFGPEGAPWNQFAPYTTPKHKTPWGDAINLDDVGSDEVRRFLIDSALAWLRDYGADGLRLDALHALVDTSESHFVAELVDEVHELGRTLNRTCVLIGEYDDHDPRSVTARTRGGWGLDAHWHDDFHHAVHAMLTGEHHGYYADFAEPGTFAKVMQEGYALCGGYSPFREKHHGHPYGDLPRDRLVAYVQSHDQIGNRARGERLHQLAGLPRARMAAAMLMVSPFVPMLFQGEEWAASTPFLYFADLESDELRRAVREGRAAEHGGAGWEGSPPDPSDVATRDHSVLRWEERDEPAHGAMLSWYRALIAARRDYPVLRDPRPGTTHVTRDGDLLVVSRGDLELSCNLSDRPRPVKLGEVVLASVGLPSNAELPPLACALTQSTRR